MNLNLSIIFSVLLLSMGILIPAYAQSTADHIVINEVETNPPGSDFASITEWVELYNPTDADVDLSGWKIASSTVLKKTMTITEGMIIKPKQFLTYSYQSIWFTDSNESVELLDGNGRLVDKTPTVSDIANDFTSWQRLYDGYDSDSSEDWKFVKSTAGSSNGRQVTSQESQPVAVTVSTDKSSYLFGETAVIKGSVSKKIFVVKPFFHLEPAIIGISGSNFEKTITLYPDTNLNFHSTLSLHKVLGIHGGIYEVSVTYADATANTRFAVGSESVMQEETKEMLLGVTTEKFQYIPGQTVSIIGNTSETIPYEGVKFTVVDSNDKVISDGNLFPIDGRFATDIFITTVDAAIGTYTVNVTYSDRHASATFAVVEDFKEDVPISLWTDKVAYALGEKVTVNGRLNQIWTNTLDLEVVQTKQLAIKPSQSMGSSSAFKILDGIRIMGDGSFTYAFTIPESQIRLGDYKISVSQSIGYASTVIHVVSNPDEFVISDEPITINSDRQVYDLGDSMIITGFIEDPFSNSSYRTGDPVKIFITNEDGTSLKITGSNTQKNNGATTAAYDFTAIPETSGKFSIRVDLSRVVFSEGVYAIKAKYHDTVATTTFTINKNPLDLRTGAVISLDKDVYGLGETVKLTGILPPMGDSAVLISLTRPDGTVTNSGTVIENQQFSWSWNTPVAEKPETIKINDRQDAVTSNFGVYKINISTNAVHKDVFFKISSDPENDFLSKVPLYVTTEKSLYKAGEQLKVLGNVLKRDHGSGGFVIPQRVTIKVLYGDFPFKQIHESMVYPNQGGTFSSVFELPTTIFDTGSYTVKAYYTGIQTKATFGVVNNAVFDVDEPADLLLSIDKSEYYPGDTVSLAGKPDKIIYLEKYDVSVIQKSDAGSTAVCGAFYCGTQVGSMISFLPSSSASFTHQFEIPDLPASVGSYEIKVDAGFETESLKFDVVERLQTVKPETLIKKENRIPDRIIIIPIESEIFGDMSVLPKIVAGSLITPIRSDESSVNLMVSTAAGVCIIGSDDDCKVRESTRKPGQIYDIVEADGFVFKVRYSGPDVRLEKFSILPASPTDLLPDSDWNVEVLKDDQSSRFYYSLIYSTG